MVDDDEKDNPPEPKLEMPKSATGTVLGVPRVPAPADVTIPDSADSDAPKTILDASPPNLTIPLDVPDLDELVIPDKRAPAPKPGSGTVKGLGPSPSPRAGPPQRPQPPIPSYRSAPPAPPDEPPMPFDPGEGELASPFGTDAANESAVRLPGAFTLPKLPERRVLYMIGGGVAVVLLLLIVSVATCDGDDAEVADASGGDAIEPPAELAGGSEAEAEAPLPEPRELTRAESRELDRLRTQGRARFAAGRFDDAAQLYRQAIAIDPSQPGLHAGLGASLSEAGDVAGAIAAYTMAARLEPESSGFHAALGRVYREEGNVEAALAHYERALELDGENHAAKRAIAELGR